MDALDTLRSGAHTIADGWPRLALVLSVSSDDEDDELEEVLENSVDKFFTMLANRSVAHLRHSSKTWRGFFVVLNTKF
ncbi:hypothetical protein BpHYR1_009607 [Brachionus plicatilis]|uniref:Uncharacterized protein n=1 Tax=Brachionus plicatilis TaxID=10195 RepID=A0A3M7T5X2_BRAPC|nr:hypothetical protein BpHYR1_009607 [Brachionus plicatilis]